MKYLYLLRHAKSDWLNDVDDRERVLNYNGELEARKLGKELKQRNLVFDGIFSSPACRAMQTIEIVKDIACPKQSINVVESFYFSDYQKIIEEISLFDNKLDSVLLVGHNPTWSDLVRILSVDHPRVYLDNCNFVALKYDSDNWKSISDSCCELDYIINPRNM